MSAYQPQGIVVGPQAGPGLPRRSSAGAMDVNLAGFPARYIIVRSNQTIRVPGWATYYRAGAVGSGGNGGIGTGTVGGGGGGGGGFSGTDQEKIVGGNIITVRFDPTAVIVEAPGYRLSGGNGASAVGGTVITGGAAGVGSGGSINFNGGAGANGSNNGTALSGGAGGAAGRGGNGLNGGAPSATDNGTGGNGAPGTGFLFGSSGGGTRNSGNNTGLVGTPPAGAGTFGFAGIILGFSTSLSNGIGGDGGGGGAGRDANNVASVAGGAGFALIEFW